jgi:energy-coupling factor transport system permease protein
LTDRPTDAATLAASADAPSGLPPGIGEPGPSSWHRLDPLTRLVVAVATVAAVILAGGIVVPLLLGLVGVVLPGVVARIGARLARLTLAVALPLAVSATLVNVLFSPGGATLIAEVGPLRITSEGISTALQVVVRVVVMGGAVALFYLTTRPAELVASLQAHGASARAAFVVHDAVAMIPRVVERSAEVGAAQRARGLDTDGSLPRRLRGILAVAGPTIGGAIEEAETRALALESRGFTRPGRRTQLWVPADSTSQRLARWALGVAVLALLAVRLADAVRS